MGHLRLCANRVPAAAVLSWVNFQSILTQFHPTDRRARDCAFSSGSARQFTRSTKDTRLSKDHLTKDRLTKELA